jgi:hypothetical protein
VSSAFNGENPRVLNSNGLGTTTTAALETRLTATALGRPFIESWPSNLPLYAVQLIGGAKLAQNTYNAILQVLTLPLRPVSTPAPQPRSLWATGGIPPLFLEAPTHRGLIPSGQFLAPALDNSTVFNVNYRARPACCDAGLRFSIVRGSTPWRVRWAAF